MDSDDDGDYKRGRDKFRSERRGGGGYGGGGGGYDGGHNSPPPAPRREWRDARPGPTGAYGRDGGGRHLGGGGNSRYDGGGNGYGGGGGGRRHSDRYSPGPPSRRMASPPHKRMRGNDWDDRGGYDGGHHRGGDHYDRGHRGGGGGGGGGGSHDDSIQPAMMSFKLFLGTQDDTITDEDAIKKYAEYKLEFKRQQLNEFFVHHKEEECHPTPRTFYTAKSPSLLPLIKSDLVLVNLPLLSRLKRNPSLRRRSSSLG